jgi:proteasome accessory factor C
VSRPNAGERMRRVLAIVPWIVAHNGVELTEVAARFGIPERELTSDLEVVWMVGLPPYTPDSLVEVVIEDGRVWIHYADFFERPLRLTPAQGLALLASADALLGMPGTDPDGPLARALAKLAAALGVDADLTVDVELGAAEAEVLDELRRAVQHRHEVALSYYSYGRDAHTERDVAPWRVFADGGAWYLHAWCQQAGDERVFRVDRIASVQVLDRPRSREPEPGEELLATFQPQPDDPRVTLDLAPAASWVSAHYPVERVEQRDDGWQRVTLAVAAPAWLDRLLLRLGRDAEVVDGSGIPDLHHRRAAAAQRVLARYSAHGPDGGATGRAPRGVAGR